jgi:hypothetical protein
LANRRFRERRFRERRFRERSGGCGRTAKRQRVSPSHPATAKRIDALG